MSSKCESGSSEALPIEILGWSSETPQWALSIEIWKVKNKYYPAIWGILKIYLKMKSRINTSLGIFIIKFFFIKESTQQVEQIWIDVTF